MNVLLERDRDLSLAPLGVRHQVVVAPDLLDRAVDRLARSLILKPAPRRLLACERSEREPIRLWVAGTRHTGTATSLWTKASSDDM